MNWCCHCAMEAVDCIFDHYKVPYKDVRGKGLGWESSDLLGLARIFHSQLVVFGAYTLRIVRSRLECHGTEIRNARPGISSWVTIPWWIDISLFITKLHRLHAVMNLVLVYAGTPTISANFRLYSTLISPFFIATSHLYIAALRHSPTSKFYLHLLCRYIPLPTSHQHPMSHRTLRRIDRASLHRIATASCHSTCRMHVTMQQVWTRFRGFSDISLQRSSPESSRPLQLRSLASATSYYT